MKDRTIGSIVSLQRGNSYKSKLLGGEGPKLLGLGSIAKDGGFKGNDLKNYSGPTDPRHLLRPGDIYVSLKDVTQSGDLLGSIARVPEHIELGRLTQDTVKLEFLDAQFSRTYLYWALRTPQYRAYCRAHALGTTNLSLSREDFLSFVLPPLTPSRATIVDVLENLEAKIQVNRRMAATLEEMARALYRSWFVDFDPVTARAQGRAPAHMDPATAALFPARFNEDGLPEGWEMARLAEVCEHVKRTVKPQDAPLAPFQHFSLPAFDKGDGPEHVTGADIKSNKLDVPNDAILFSRLNPSIPRVWWARVDPTHGAPAASTEFFVARAPSERQTPWLYALLSSAGFRDDAMSRVTGTSNSHQRVPPTSLSQVEIVHPPPEVREAFGSVALPWFRRAQAASDENRTLAALRDALLPKLMSGELRVREAEAQVGEVA